MPNAIANPLQDLAFSIRRSGFPIARCGSIVSGFQKRHLTLKVQIASSGPQNRCSWLFNDISAAYFGENL
jgi:hypothetical protein